MRPPSLPALSLALAAFLALGVGCAPEAERPATDDLGRPVTLEDPARRVAALTPALAALVAEASGPGALLALPSGEGARPGGWGPEALAGLGADLVLADAALTDAMQADRLEAAVAPTFALALTRLSDVPRGLRLLDGLLGSEGGGLAAAAFETRLADVERAVGGAERLRVLILRAEPSGPAIATFGRGAHVGEMVRSAGGLHLGDDLEGSAAEVSEAFVRDAVPDVIVVLTDAPFDRRDLAVRYPDWLDVPAVREGRVYALSPALVEPLGVRTAEGVARLARLLHPDLFAAGAA